MLQNIQQHQYQQPNNNKVNITIIFQNFLSQSIIPKLALLVRLAKAIFFSANDGLI